MTFTPAEVRALHSLALVGLADGDRALLAVGLSPVSLDAGRRAVETLAAARSDMEHMR
jgi:hypothetical protein